MQSGHAQEVASRRYMELRSPTILNSTWPAFKLCILWGSIWIPPGLEGDSWQKMAMQVRVRWSPHPDLPEVGQLPSCPEVGQLPSAESPQTGMWKASQPSTAQGRLWYRSDLAGRPGNGLNLRRTFQQWPLPIMNATTLMQRNLKDSAKGQPSSGAQAKAFALQISGSRSLVGCSCWV